MARLRESRDPAGGRADWVGTALITGALTALMFALIRGNALGWASPAIVAMFATAAVAFAGFVIYELRIAAAPMADLRLFRRRSFAATGFVAFAISATVIGMIIYLSLYVQNTLGYSPVQPPLSPAPRRPQRTGRPARHRPAPSPATGRAQNNATIARQDAGADPPARPSEHPGASTRAD